MASVIAPAFGGTSPSAAAPSTAAGLLAMLSEPEAELRSFALKSLLDVVDVLWHEVAESITELEELAESEELDKETRQTAASVASRVFFHLEEPVQALRLALEGTAENFDVVRGGRSLYVETLVSAAVDEYVKRRRTQFEEGDESQPRRPKGEEKKDDADDDDGAAGIDMEKLVTVVNLMFERCYADGTYRHALGVAFESREVDKVKEILQRCASASTPSVLQTTLLYAMDSAVTLVTSKAFRAEVLSVIAERLTDQSKEGTPSSLRRSACVALCRVHQLLANPLPVAKIVASMLDANENDALLGFQICFDLIDTGDRSFVSHVAEGLPQKPEGEETDSSEAARSDEVWARFESVRRVLEGGFVSDLALSFLHKNSDSDRRIMENLKRSLEERGGGGRNSILHNCAVACHAYLNAGTTNDSFLRDHLDWMRKAADWAKFSATASLGVIHAGHTTEAMSLLEPYLPAAIQPDEAAAGAAGVSTTGGYAEGGSLYALGLIHGSHAGSSESKRIETCNFLRGHLRASHANEAISHGAALGVGLTAFATADLATVNELKELLYTDSAVAGEAAGIAIGLVLVGSGASNVGGTSGASEELYEIVSELRNYARETQHEKIIRGIAMAIALINYGQEENADLVIEEMKSDRDPIIRYGAAYALALAYCGTGSNRAVRTLLHTAVSDVSDDVRMASVIGLAFVLYKTPERVPELVKLLLESFNPHVRYASCMAVGIAMAGTGDAEAIALLEPMLDDMTDFVRQGALIGTAMIYMQQSDSCNIRKIRTFRERLASVVGDKHQSTLTKMGAILSTGVIDAGGRNCSLYMGSMTASGSSAGTTLFTNMTSAVGIALWLQHWHWYPLMHMMSLALSPTFAVGLNKNFQYPKTFEMQCNSRPSVFAYPKRLEEKKEEKKRRVETVTLSTTAKNKARLARKKAQEDPTGTGATAEAKGEGAGSESKDDSEGKKDVAMEDVAPSSKGDTAGGEGENMDVDNEKEGSGAAGEGADEKPRKKKREPEATSFRLSNPTRVTKAQADVCTFDLSQRYRPVRPEQRPFGVIILTDSTPGEEEELGTVKPPSLGAEDEAEPPEPFEWTPPGHPDAENAAEETTTNETNEEEEDKDKKKDKDSSDGDAAPEPEADPAST